MRRILLSGEPYRQKMMEAFDLVLQYTSHTLGVFGLSTVLDRGFLVPTYADDGVSILNALEVDDDVMRQGVESIKEVASKTNQEAGDGTTTSIVLAHALASEGIRYSENPLEIKRSLDKAKDKAIELLKGMSNPLKTDKEILEVATLSAGSKELGRQIFDVFKEVGRNAVISVEEGKLPETEIKIVEGYEVEKGWASPYMANEGRVSHDNVKVLVVGSKIDNVPEIMPLFNKMLAEKIRDFVLFCSDMDKSIIETILLNRQMGNFKCLVVKANTQKQEVLQDIAIITGATYISTEAGKKLEDAEISDLGMARRISATEHKTIILGGKGNVKKKIKELKESLPSTKDTNQYDLIEKRIARLDNKVAVISVGAKTSNEMQPKFLKMEDAVNAVKSALEEGFVEGGGMTLYKISRLLGDTVGERILSKALRAPLKTLCKNAGKDYTEILLNMPKGKGYNAETNEYVDMKKIGLIDPTKVQRCAIENSVSFAGTFITSRGVIAMRKEEEKENG